MENMSFFAINLFSMARMLGRSPAGGLLELPSGAVAAASGYPAAGENYLLLTADTAEGETEESLRFFSRRRLSFVAPALPNANRIALGTLEKAQIDARITYTAMSLDLERFRADDAPDDGLVRVSTPKEVRQWGQTVWKGFGGGVIDAGYAALTRHMAGQSENTLYTLRDGGDAVACGLLHRDVVGGCGLYYFATKPAFRRKGYARRLMNGIAREAAAGHDKLLLLATPAGLLFYTDFGFASLAKVPMLSGASEL